VAQHSLGTTYAELWKVICTRDGILAPRAISMRIAIDLVIRVETAAEAEAVQGGLKAGSAAPNQYIRRRKPQGERTAE
jgi:hypothetical protein